MNTFDRRKFLKSVLCGAGLMIVGSRPLSLLANPSAKNNPAELSDSALLLKQFEEARTLFHKKQFTESELLYKSMLAGVPAHISIYDCYKNLDGTGRIREVRSYDPWGRRRNPADWEDYATVTPSKYTLRGYTFQEEMPQFGLVNLNGRLYDPLLARMLSPDPYVQEPGMTQS